MAIGMLKHPAIATLIRGLLIMIVLTIVGFIVNPVLASFGATAGIIGFLINALILGIVASWVVKYVKGGY